LAAGGYGLNLHAARLGWREPLRIIFRETGSWMMVLTSLLYAYTSVMGKLAVLHSSPLFAGGFYTLCLVIILVLAGAVSGRLTWGWLRRPRAALALAVAMAGMAVCHYLAISMTNVAYMIAVKRVSPLFAVIYGGLLLGEQRLGQHLWATALMLAGAVLITLAG
jgi:drug/metabolite transporter (DMT)-like permease